MKTITLQEITVDELLDALEDRLAKRDVDGWHTKAELMKKYDIKDHRTVNSRVTKGSILKKSVGGCVYYKAI